MEIERARARARAVSRLFACTRIAAGSLPIAEIGLVYGNHRSSLKKLAGWVLLGPVVINNNKVLAPLCLFRNWLPRTQPPVSMYCLCLTS